MDHQVLKLLNPLDIKENLTGGISSKKSTKNTKAENKQNPITDINKKVTARPQSTQNGYSKQQGQSEGLRRMA